MKPPERAHVIALNLQADSLEEIRAALSSILFEMERGLVEGGTVSGSPSSGWTMGYWHNPEMTHEKYAQALDEWLKLRKAMED